MKKFIVIYHATAASNEQMETMTPEQKAKGMEPWMQWKASIGDMVVDFGAPLAGGQSIRSAGVWETSTKEVSGFSILQGENLDVVKAALTNHPHLAWGEGSSIEVHEYVPM